ncbi:putative Glutamine--scyllo-inositol transaminase [Thiomonas arsenitoxydans]|uniref:GDP-perosamine synthase n=1 Tax=Thiomonas arsenitoxydans (strain DSM 22701 / CIP 110005 / 3As) TaxID=426114 RepID=D6CRS5_THIA3|nr:aminotransferase class I/II-fold pyridoxal phosphate-dependent enzyme [Thiomonas arsenitoxydans]CAZ87316.1 putative Glutamine--scyllo-inositol transaminase [Thiomonas arsenitoxydans]CQR28756.1 putative Glutamine--scyllo-inositol transaminase [Thiomonas arsenitoxydans]CQR28864.1 putative Glutamine--scyllo-inositol transaminase [Thiomonas arsenitoxydans]CQR28865.1 putative Glutamine--scyllo-inositol transaminase [Thiomonas arsenitoxydans]CQR29837.1 putative Glutamine--scyllo-inositol transami
MKLNTFNALCLPPGATLHEALARLDATAQGILLVTDEQGRLLRTVTDGDLRRAALAGVSNEAPLSALPAHPPHTVGLQASQRDVLALMDAQRIDHVPVVDAAGRAVDLVTRRELSQRVYLSSPHLGEDEVALVQEAFTSNWIAPLGPHVDAFERELAARVGVQHAAATSSGTAALHLGLRLLGVGPGDVVLCSSLTFVASANPIKQLGATPVFIDSEPQSWNLSPQALAVALAALQAEGITPKAAVVVNLYGQSAEMDEIAPLLERYGVPMLEDAAESLGATYRDRPSGSFGKLAVFSFNGNKIITTSGGGMLVSNDAALIEHARKLSTQAREPARHYEHIEDGYNYRLSNVLAGIGRGQLRVLEQRVQSRREVFAQYRDALSAVPGLRWMAEPDGHQSTRWLSAFVLEDGDGESPQARRDALLDFLERHNVEARPVWKPMHLQPLYAGCRYFAHEPHQDVSRALFEGGVCLPSGSNMSAAQRARVCELVARGLELSWRSAA